VKEVRGNSPNKTDEKDPQDIAGLGCDGLVEILKKTSRGRMGKERAEALYEAAVNSVGVRGARKYSGLR
jgi:hypothetical protein